MRNKPIDSNESANQPPVPRGFAGLTGYLCAIGSAAVLALTLVAFGYGFVGWGVVGAVATVALIAATAYLSTHARPRRPINREAIRRRFRVEARRRSSPAG